MNWFYFSSPSTFYGLAGRLAPWFFALAAVTAVWGLYLGLLVAPTDAQQGEVYRVIFIHVPTAWMSMFLYFVMACYCGLTLVFNTRLSAMMARAIAPTGALFTAVALWTGSFWGKPTWGTCAGMILLSDRATGQKQGGQALIGGLDVTVNRNYFGRQIDSFEADLQVPALGDTPVHAVFIRAPAITQTGPDVDILATLIDNAGQRVIVAVQAGPILATAFHPELTDDLRWHELFVGMVAERSGVVKLSLIHI